MLSKMSKSCRDTSEVERHNRRGLDKEQEGRFGVGVAAVEEVSSRHERMAFSLQLVLVD